MIVYVVMRYDIGGHGIAAVTDTEEKAEAIKQHILNNDETSFASVFIHAHTVV